jgi:hypothetical protein
MDAEISDAVGTRHDRHAARRAQRQALSGVALVFTDKMSEVSGLLTDDQGQPITEFTVLAFPTDNTLWRRRRDKS